MAASEGLPGGDGNPLRRSARWTALRRDTYLEVLRATGNARAAAEAIGMDRTTIEHRCREDPGFARACVEARAEADQTLSGRKADEAAGGAPAAGADPFETVRRGSNGRLQIVAAGRGRWNGRAEACFFAYLRVNGNMSAAARAAGFSPETVWERRRNVPAFAARLEKALEEAEVALEFRLAVPPDAAAREAGAEEEEGARAGEAAAAQARFDPEFALKFLKWREEKRNGGGRRGRPGTWLRKEPSSEEVRDEVLKRIAAIRRHRERYGDGAEGNEGGDSDGVRTGDGQE